ncbi:MAG: Crp/Fnr family transcriptional regulator [Fibromonadales bacterium]|nr:Crp/Fnr family transcriptional regulator [Fibromonadales bacterium]
MRKKKPKTPPEAPLSITELLRRVDFFSEMDDATLSRFEKIGTVLHFQNDETMLLAGDTRRYIFFISHGQAKIFHDIKHFRNNILNLLGVGDFFGEIQLFNENGKSTVSVKAEGQCTVVTFKGKDFVNEIISDPKLSIAFFKQTTQKINKSYMQIACLSMNTLKGRIMSCLMQFVEERGVRIQRNKQTVIVLKNRPTQQQIAEMSGTSRETVNRELSDFIKNGYIELDGTDMFLIKELPID